jgi:hypothetical protein
MERQLYAAADAPAGNYEVPLNSSLPLPAPFSALLSQFLVAFTIEFDNEFERRMPHRTTNHGSTGPGPWLVSMAMWFTCMRFVTDEGVTAGELTALARTDTNLNGMERWGYITIDAPQTAERAKRVRANSMIRPTAYGRQAQQVWRQLFRVVEGRWQERFGQSEAEGLRAALLALVDRRNPDLPDCMPILGYGLFSRLPEKLPVSATSRASLSDAPLPVLLARVLLAFAIEFERGSDVSLAISANVLRNVKDEGTAVRELPRMAGVSKEAIAVAVGFLEKRGFARKAGVLELTAKGRRARDAYSQRTREIEDDWSVTARVREVLERLAPLLTGIDFRGDGWRASVPKPDGLPHFPMTLHRGGCPDGS